jgi:hypothetical protein
MRRRLTAILMSAAVVGAVAGPALPAYANGHHPNPTPPPPPPPPPPVTVTVGGEVTAPATYTVAELGAMAQTTVTITVGKRQISETGVLLETLVTDAGPAYPASLVNTKNELLRVTATVSGRDQRDAVTFAVGELDPNFGDHPALLALSQNGHALPFGPALIVPGDSFPARIVPDVRNVAVGIATAPATDTAPAAGSPVEVIDGSHHVLLSATQLARLPSETLTVSFAGPSGEQTHTETGPSLLAVLWAARMPVTLNTWVAATGDDDYVATVTPAEQLVGGRDLQLSLAEDGVALAQPRLVASGDVKGGRYVSGVVDLYVGSGPAD